MVFETAEGFVVDETNTSFRNTTECMVSILGALPYT